MEPRPPVTQMTHTLPFEKLGAFDFERLCFWLVREEGYQRVEALGQAGGEQGRDIIGWKDGRCVAFQCKRVRRFGPQAAKAEIRKIRSLPEDEQPKELIFLVTCSVSVKTRTVAKHAWGDAENCSFWAGEELDHMAKKHPRVVREFFSLGAWGPVPSYANDGVRKLGEALEAAYFRLEEIISKNQDTTEIRKEIVELKRRIREGGRLTAGDLLADGRFRLIELLGHGGFGSVFRAYDREQRCSVAVKVLHGQYSEDRTRRERFFRGARTMANLKHQGIVQIAESELEESGHFFFVMEYMEGGDLRDAVFEDRLSTEAGLEVICQVADSLSFAHKKGVIHRDIKPANILLTAKGEAKLTDFDLVFNEDTTGGTRTDSVLGTFPYIAPEVLESSKAPSACSEVYALGMTLAFVLHGQDIPILIWPHREKFLEELDCSQGLKEVVARATSWKPEERFDTVTQFREAVAHQQSGGHDIEIPEQAPGHIVNHLGPVDDNEAFGFLRRNGRLELDVWRSLSTLPGYPACTKVKSDAVNDIVKTLFEFQNLCHKRASVGILLQTDYGAEDTLLARSLAQYFEFSMIRFDITQMLSRDDLIDCFDTVATHQAADGADLMIVVDEANALLHGTPIYSAFLKPLESGIYMRGGRHFMLHPCFWLFTEKRTKKSAASRREINDFKSCMSLVKAIDFRSLEDSCRKEIGVFYSRIRLEQIYLGATIIHSYYPDVTRVSKEVLEIFYNLDPALSPAIHVRRLCRSLELVQYGQISRQNCREWNFEWSDEATEDVQLNFSPRR